jgi:hypothetical protein
MPDPYASDAIKKYGLDIGACDKNFIRAYIHRLLKDPIL